MKFSMKPALLLLCLAGSVTGYSGGAPAPRCEDMIPGHGVAPQNGPSPFKAIPINSSINVGEHLDIVLASESEQDFFKGFLVQVRMIEGDKSDAHKAMGWFDPKSDPNAKSLDCQNQASSAMTHNSSQPKNLIVLKWFPDRPGKFKIHSTFVEEKEKYWVDQQSDQVIQVYEPITSSQKKQALCSTMNFDKGLKVNNQSNPYQVEIKPVAQARSGLRPDKLTIHRRDRISIKVTSEFSSPIERLFLQVRKSKTGQSAFGKFIVPSQPKDSTRKYYFQTVDCFQTKSPDSIFALNVQGDSISNSDVSVEWEAPNEIGDFELLGTLATKEYFFPNIGKTNEAMKIKVVDKVIVLPEGKVETKQSGQKGKNGGNMLSSTGDIKLTIFLIALFVTI